MNVTIRVPFNEMIESRNATLDKDALTTNLFFDSVQEGALAVKRPGLDNKTSALGLGIEGALGIGQGIFYYEDTVYSFNSVSPGTVYDTFVSGPYGLVISAKTEFMSDPEEPRQLLITTVGELFPVDRSGQVFAANDTTFFGIGEDDIGNSFAITSPDGIDWTETAQIFSYDFPVQSGGIVGTTLIAVSGNGTRSYTSTDSGVTYTTNTIDIDASGNDGVMVASSGTRMSNGRFYTTNGGTWTEGTGDFRQALFEFEPIVYGDEEFIVIDTNSANGFPTFVHKSSDGIAWTRTAIVGIAPRIPAYNSVLGMYSGVFVTDVTGVTYSCRSTDAITWTNTIIPSLPAPTQMTSHAGVFYGLSEISTGPYPIAFALRSEDGLTWLSYVLDVALFNETPTLVDGLV